MKIPHVAHFSCAVLLLAAVGCAPGAREAEPEREVPAAVATPIAEPAVQSAVAAPAAAPEFQVVLDDAAAERDAFRVTPGADGVAVTTGPAGLLYPTDAATRLSGDYTVAAIVRQTVATEHAEGYGIFIGGADLDGSAPRYTYFLVRKDGKVLVKQRMGADTETLLPWTAVPAVQPADAAGQQQTTLQVRSTGGEVVFLANGAEVARLPASAVSPAGVAGYRVNHNLRVHLGELRVDGR